MIVPFFDLSAQYDELRDEILAAIGRSCAASSFVLGPDVEAFEREFAEYCGVRHCVAVNSGTSALHIALLAAGVQSGDEVITTPSTFIATAEAISYTGAKPVFVDVDPATGNLDPSLLEDSISERTRAIVPVHLYGRPAEIDAIGSVAQRNGIAVVEDACQAHGARFNGHRVGSFSTAAAFSFYPSKNLGAYGEGGALVTNAGAIAEYAREMRNHGQMERHQHVHVGFNYRMDAIQAVVLRAKLKHLDVWNDARRLVAERYRELLEGHVGMLQDMPGVESVYHLFVVYCEERDRVREELGRFGVSTGIHYPVPIHLQQAYAHLGYAPGSFPIAELASATTLSLPLYPEIPFKHVEYVAASILKAVDRAKSLAGQVDS